MRKGAAAVAVTIASAVALAAGVVTPASSAPAGDGKAQAAKKKGGKIKAMPDRPRGERRAATRLARAISRKNRWIRRAVFSAIPPFSNPAALASKPLADFPRHGGRYAILSSGDATDADDANFSDGHSTSLGGPSVRGARDVTILRITLRVPKKANCLSLRFRFLSEEFPEYVDEQYNDAFIAELDTSNWDTVSKEDPRVEAPNNFAAGPEGSLITVNKQGDTSVTAGEAKGTTYDGATPILRASTRITPGRHILYLSIFDQGDREYDSAVFLDNLNMGKRKHCNTGAVVEN